MNIANKPRWKVNYSVEQYATRIERLEEENAKLKEQNIQYEFALKLLIDELNELKD